MSKKKFELGKDVERALWEIISINDNLSDDVKRRIEERRKEDEARF